MASLLKNRFVKQHDGIDFSRSLFPYERRHSFNFLAGGIYPVQNEFLYPGDSPDWNFGCVLESAPLIGTNFDNIYVDVVSIWCPMRLVMTDWNEFLGESNSQAFTINRSITIPKIKQVNIESVPTQGGSVNVSRAYVSDCWLAPHLGFRLHTNFDVTASGSISTKPNPESIFAKGISVIPSRVYELNYNTFFRNENVEAPILIDKTSVYGLHDATYIQGLGSIRLANKLKTWYTVATPAPSLIDVSIGLGELLPVGAVASTSATVSGNPGAFFPNGAIGSGDFLGAKVGGSVSGFSSQPIVVDTAALTVNKMYYALMEQRFANKMMKGRRAVEFYKNFFGVNDSAAADDLPQLICQKRYPINVSAVIATAASTNTDGETTNLGEKGAFSITGFGDPLVKNFTATEHGYFQTYIIVRGQPSLSNGIDHHLGFDGLLDTYIPEFDHIGPVGIEQLEVTGITPVSASVPMALNFGFTNAWYFERNQVSDCCGIIEPGQPLAYKTLANDYQPGTGYNQTVISQGFLKYQPLLMDRIFLYPNCTGTLGDGTSNSWLVPYNTNRYQFICQFVVKGKIAKVMSPDSEPLKLRL